VARIRSVKPEFFRHEGLYEAERETGLPLRLAFAGLWTAADREGRFKWLPRQLKLDCLPYDDVDFSRVLDALATRGFIVSYEAEGKTYGYIPSWHDHQVINNREAASTLPEPSNIKDLTRAPRVLDACATPLVHTQGEGKGRERKGREGKGREGKGTIGADAPDGGYAFEGKIVRLRRKSLDDWIKAYPNLDLIGELTARDAWLASDRATDEDRKRWFVSTSQHLANRNMTAKAKVVAMKPDGRPMTRAEELRREGII
jgi:hypothetical protein